MDLRKEDLQALQLINQLDKLSENLELSRAVHISVIEGYEALRKFVKEASNTIQSLELENSTLRDTLAANSIAEIENTEIEIEELD